MTARDDLEIFSLGKTSLCHKGPLKNSTTSFSRSIPLANIYRLVIHVSLRLLMYTATYPGFFHLPIFTPTFHPICPRLLKGIPAFHPVIYVYLPPPHNPFTHVYPELSTFYPVYKHFILFINILFCL